MFHAEENTKLFTAVSAGLLVEAGRLTWDKEQQTVWCDDVVIATKYIGPAAK